MHIHNLSLSRYMRMGGLTRLDEEQEAENGRVDTLAEIMWLGMAKVCTRYQEIHGGSLSVVAVSLRGDPQFPVQEWSPAVRATI